HAIRGKLPRGGRAGAFPHAGAWRRPCDLNCESREVRTSPPPCRQRNPCEGRASFYLSPLRIVAKPSGKRTFPLPLRERVARCERERATSRVRGILRTHDSKTPHPVLASGSDHPLPQGERGSASAGPLAQHPGWGASLPGPDPGSILAEGEDRVRGSGSTMSNEDPIPLTPSLPPSGRGVERCSPPVERDCPEGGRVKRV